MISSSSSSMERGLYPVSWDHWFLARFNNQGPGCRGNGMRSRHIPADSGAPRSTTSSGGRWTWNGYFCVTSVILCTKLWSGPFLSCKTVPLVFPWKNVTLLRIFSVRAITETVLFIDCTPSYLSHTDVYSSYMYCVIDVVSWCRSVILSF